MLKRFHGKLSYVCDLHAAALVTGMSLRVQEGSELVRFLKVVLRPPPADTERDGFDAGLSCCGSRFGSEAEEQHQGPSKTNRPILREELSSPDLVPSSVPAQMSEILAKRVQPQSFQYRPIV